MTAETPVACAKRQLAEYEDADARGVEDLSLPSRDDWRFEQERGWKLAALRRAVVEAEAAEQQRQRDAAQAHADEVVQRSAPETRHVSESIETPDDDAPKVSFHEFVARKLGEKFRELRTKTGEQIAAFEAEMKAEVRGYLTGQTAATEARLAELERRLSKLERRR